MRTRARARQPGLCAGHMDAQTWLGPVVIGNDSGCSRHADGHGGMMLLLTRVVGVYVQSVACDWKRNVRLCGPRPASAAVNCDELDHHAADLRREHQPVLPAPSPQTLATTVMNVPHTREGGKFLAARPRLVLVRAQQNAPWSGSKGVSAGRARRRLFCGRVVVSRLLKLSW